jgi:hypothetical protein
MSPPRSVRVLFACFPLWCCMGFGNLSAAKASEQPPPLSQDLEQKKFDLEERRLTLDKEKLEQDKQKDAKNFKVEITKARWNTLSIAVPLFLGVVAYLLQIIIQRRNESLQFQLKAAEIAMTARDSNQVAAKGAILKALFPKKLKEFAIAAFNPKEFPFSASMEMRERLIALLAENPGSRGEIIRAWGLMFPWDRQEWDNLKPEEKGKYKWFDKLEQDISLTQNRPSDPWNFKLKAAEIAMTARDSNQVAAKAALLKALFPKELEGFEPENVDLKQFPFSGSVEMRERLIALLAENPGSRAEIIRFWALMFPWDRQEWDNLKPEEKRKYKWLDKLEQDIPLTQNRPSDPKQS